MSTKYKKYTLSPHQNIIIMLGKNKNNQSEQNQPIQESTGLTPEKVRFYEMQKTLSQHKAGFPKTELLEAGGVVQWLQLRADQLMKESDSNRNHGGISQLLGLSIGVGAFALTGTTIAPLAPIAIGLGLFGYAASVADSAFRLKRILPIPFSGFTLQKLATATSADGREALEANYDETDPERANTLSFLPTGAGRELAMIVDYHGMLLELLAEVPEGKRFAVYFVLRQACIDGGFGNNSKIVASELNNLKDRVELDTTLDAELMEEIKFKLNPPPEPEENDEVTFLGHKTLGEKMQYRLPMDETRKEKLAERATHKPEDLIPALTDEVGNTIICSPGGGGKGIIISNALREIKRKHPDIHIFYIDPKADPKERGYLAGCVDTYRSYKTLGADPADAVEAFEEFWQQFYAVGGRKLLVLDEATTLGIKYGLVGKAELLKSRIGELPSLGGSSGIASWIVVQNPHVKDIGVNTGILSQFARLALLCTKKGEASASFDMMKRTKFTANDKYFWDDVRVLCDQSEVDRAYFYTKFDEWVPMPKMTNYSGYDRDSNTFIEGYNATANLPISEIPPGSKKVESEEIEEEPINQNTADKLDKLFNEGLDSKYADISENALLVLDKLKEANREAKGEPVKVKTVCDKVPLGRENKSAKAIRYYLDELIIANLARKIGDEPGELYIAKDMN